MFKLNVKNMSLKLLSYYLGMFLYKYYFGLKATAWGFYISFCSNPSTFVKRKLRMGGAQITQGNVFQMSYSSIMNGRGHQV